MNDALQVMTTQSKEAVDLTGRINAAIAKAHVQEGLCVAFVAHTTAALTTGEIGEGTEDDLLEVIEKVIPPIRFAMVTILPMPGRIWPRLFWGRH